MYSYGHILAYGNIPTSSLLTHRINTDSPNVGQKLARSPKEKVGDMIIAFITFIECFSVTIPALIYTKDSLSETKMVQLSRPQYRINSCRNQPALICMKLL